MKPGFTQCGICTLMRELGLYDLTPALCRLDYTMNDAGGASRCAIVSLESLLPFRAPLSGAEEPLPVTGFFFSIYL